MDSGEEGGVSPLRVYIWRHSKRHSSWSMIDEPNICREGYQAAQVVVLAHSLEEALALLDQKERWDVAELRRLTPEIVPLTDPRILTHQIDPF